MDIRLLSNSDMAKLGCSECRGCSECCRGMGDSIILDPYDVMSLRANLKCSFEELMQGRIILHVEDGIILPSLAMVGNEERCSFLNEEGRCSIHQFRPGLCRLFPLGRDYSTGELKYFLLQNACTVTSRSKVKISKWLDVKDISGYEGFLTEWHNLLKKLRQLDLDEAKLKDACMLLLKMFYLQEFHEETFFEKFMNQVSEIKKVMNLV